MRDGEPLAINRTTPFDALPSMLTVPEVAAWAGVSRGVIYDACQQRSLKSVSFGRIIRIPKTQLEAWLNAESGR